MGCQEGDWGINVSQKDITQNDRDKLVNLLIEEGLDARRVQSMIKIADGVAAWGTVRKFLLGVLISLTSFTTAIIAVLTIINHWNSKQ